MKKDKLMLLLSIAGAMSGVVAVFSYIENKRKRKLQEEIFGLDREIKQLQLLDLRK